MTQLDLFSENCTNENVSLTSLVLEHFRLFKRIEITFESDLTLFVAPNGGGKTAILDAIAIALRLFVDTMEGNANSYGFDRSDIQQVMSSTGSMEFLPPVVLTAKACFFGEQKEWRRERLEGQRTTIAESQHLRKLAEDLRTQHYAWLEKKAKNPPIFPLIAYYGTGRLWANTQKKRKTDNLAPNARSQGYKDALSARSHFNHFIDWFRRYSYENALSDATIHETELYLSVVSEAINNLLHISGWGNLAWDFIEEKITAEHPRYGRLPVEVLSDGIRTMIGQIGDIAQRAVRLNPQFRQDILKKTPGIVLIDEVDMHLHPAWQQEILQQLAKTFPRIQFIVTTHSPQVLTTVPPKHIRLIETDEDVVPPTYQVKIPTHSSFARSSEDALTYLMSVDPRPPLEIVKSINRYELLVKEGMGDSDEATKIKEIIDRSGYLLLPTDLARWNLIANRKKKIGEIMVELQRRPEPTILMEYRKQKGSHWDDRAFTEKIKPKLKDMLIEDQQKICVYCEEILPEDAHIDHIKPQSRYPQESLSYTNLAVSCSNNNHCGHKKKNQLLFIEPGLGCNDHMRLLDDGSIFSRHEATQKTIELLGLNSPKLKGKRRVLVETLALFLNEDCDIEDIYRELYLYLPDNSFSYIVRKYY